MEYQVVSFPESGLALHLVRVDPKHYSFEIVQAPDRGAPRLLLPNLIGAEPVLVAINASFFDESGNALGLLVKQGVQIRPLRRAAWGVFQIKAGQPSIIHTSAYQSSYQPDLAIQSGPRLVVKGQLISFKNAIPKRRSGLCVTAAQQVLLAASSQPLTLKEFAASLQPHCRDALNLDGGSSTQFYFMTKEGEIRIEGRVPVPNALFVKEKTLTAPSNQ